MGKYLARSGWWRPVTRQIVQTLVISSSFSCDHVIAAILNFCLLAYSIVTLSPTIFFFVYKKKKDTNTVFKNCKSKDTQYNRQYSINLVSYLLHMTMIVYRFSKLLLYLMIPNLLNVDSLSNLFTSGRIYTENHCIVKCINTYKACVESYSYLCVPRQLCI